MPCGLMFMSDQTTFNIKQYYVGHISFDSSFFFVSILSVGNWQKIDFKRCIKFCCCYRCGWISVYFYRFAFSHRKRLIEAAMELCSIRCLRNYLDHIHKIVIFNIFGCTFFAILQRHLFAFIEPFNSIRQLESNHIMIRWNY